MTKCHEGPWSEGLIAGRKFGNIVLDETPSWFDSVVPTLTLDLFPLVSGRNLQKSNLDSLISEKNNLLDPFTLINDHY